MSFLIDCNLCITLLWDSSLKLSHKSYRGRNWVNEMILSRYVPGPI